MLAVLMCNFMGAHVNIFLVTCLGPSRWTGWWALPSTKQTWTPSKGCQSTTPDQQTTWSDRPRVWVEPWTHPSWFPASWYKKAWKTSPGICHWSATGATLQGQKLVHRWHFQAVQTTIPAASHNKCICADWRPCQTSTSCVCPYVW